ncbi:TPA: hypothetical protein OUF62_002911 [Listeria monocytogenes]|nr:hypothetical protein [Listeria monocytogenes]EHC6210339.1 hypothetical protein [Listeria monocytogenes serotype 1/2b]HCU0633142.1 hypothetical protein [Listeria monocytogenes]HCU0634930.1 hypothetical protein [Listeria monocytogenes]
MYMSIAENEQEIEKACDAFLGAYKKDLMKIQYTWENAYNASKGTIPLKTLVGTGKYMVKNTMRTYEDNVNKFLYVYFRNKAENVHEEIIEICKIAVKQRVLQEVEKIFLEA